VSHVHPSHESTPGGGEAAPLVGPAGAHGARPRPVRVLALAPRASFAAHVERYLDVMSHATE
jgi:hypothetical protein